MPTYDYRCESCGYEFEQFQSITAQPLKTCPNCKRRTLQRLIGPGGGIIFKGSGFYQTDYRSDSYRRAAEAEKSSPSSSSKSDQPATAGKPAASTGEKAPKKKKPASTPRP